MSLIEDARAHLRGLTSEEVQTLCHEVLHEKHEAWLDAQRHDRTEMLMTMNAMLLNLPIVNIPISKLEDKRKSSIAMAALKEAGFTGDIKIVDLTTIEVADLEGVPWIHEE